MINWSALLAFAHQLFSENKKELAAVLPGLVEDGENVFPGLTDMSLKQPVNRQRIVPN